MEAAVVRPLVVAVDAWWLPWGGFLHLKANVVWPMLQSVWFLWFYRFGLSIYARYTLGANKLQQQIGLWNALKSHPCIQATFLAQNKVSSQ